MLYTMIDVETEINNGKIDKISAIEGVLKVRNVVEVEVKVEVKAEVEAWGWGWINWFQYFR